MITTDPGNKYPSGVDPNFFKTTKIKELPIKEDVTKDCVLLIEDNQDTKQMSIEVFYNAIERIANQMLEELRTKIAEVDEFMHRMYIKEEEYAINEDERKKNNAAFIKDEMERRAQFEEWGRTWESIWNPYFDECQVRENERIENETIRIENEANRTTEWNRCTIQITQWEQDEQDRKTAEADRVIADADREDRVNAAITAINDTYLEAISACATATDKCKEVTKKLSDMFEIGSEVPTDLPENKVYFQYFD